MSFRARPHASTGTPSRRSPRNGGTSTSWLAGRIKVVGMQDIFARTDFRKTHALETGSWLGLPFQGRGVGTLMRQVVCAFCFDHLGAELMRSGYIEENASSAAVSRKVGYLDNGRRRVEDPKSNGYRWERDLLLTPDALKARPSPWRWEDYSPSCVSSDWASGAIHEHFGI